MILLYLILSVVIEVAIFVGVAWIVIFEAFLRNTLDGPTHISKTITIVLVAEGYLLNFDRFVSFITMQNKIALSFTFETIIQNYITILVMFLGARCVLAILRLTVYRKVYTDIKLKLLFLIEVLIIPYMLYNELLIFGELLPVMQN